MDEKLKEFVREWQRSRAHKPTEAELCAILEGEAKPIEFLPNGEVIVLGEDFELAQAVASFTEKRVLEELKMEMHVVERDNARRGFKIDPDFFLAYYIIDERLAALVGKEKNV